MILTDLCTMLYSFCKSNRLSLSLVELLDKPAPPTNYYMIYSKKLLAGIALLMILPNVPGIAKAYIPISMNAMIISK
jgi:hypothetical protein